ncbi:putative low-complexity protein [Leptolyngbya sp. PCC 7375]|nr:putative low-complexity protein [Leptolyngbya sp. PCC 7375]
MKHRKRVNEIARQLRFNRLVLKKQGDQKNERYVAERIANNVVRYLLFKCNQPWISLEKQCWEPLSKWAKNQDLLVFLGLIGNISILLGVAIYLGSERQRRDAEIYQAWQVITSAHGQSGSGGRKRALEFLNASPGANWRRKFPWFCAPLQFCLWPQESLAGINLSVELELDRESITELGEEYQHRSGVYLTNVELPNAILYDANLEGANLLGANLECAQLRGANLRGAILYEANLRGANLVKANLEGAHLFNANLENATLNALNLEGMDLRATNLKGAHLFNANLEGADLFNANLKGANLREANLKNTNLTVQQVNDETILCKTQLPKDIFGELIDLNPNRDCDNLKLPEIQPQQ